MFFSAIASTFKRFWLTALMVACVAFFSLYYRLGDIVIVNGLLIVFVSVLAILLCGIPLEYGRRNK